jgi:hypothetical protein
MAMQETLACVINMHGESVDEESSYQFFGRRNLNGIPMRTPGSCANLPWIEIQFQDMRCIIWTGPRRFSSRTMRSTISLKN